MRTNGEAVFLSDQVLDTADEAEASGRHVNLASVIFSST